MATKFADMPVGERAGWLDWAKGHDWGAGEPRWASEDPDFIYVECAARDEGGDWYVESATFDNPRDLRAWAGY